MWFKNMNNRLLLAFCSVLFWSTNVEADYDNEVKRGTFPFMAILYYPDETVVDVTGARFQHAAVLIKLDWLLSAAIDHSVLDNVTLGFPRKTLIARAGALVLDANFTLNEDEDEQEREVIQIVKPNIHNREVWWFTDITLLHTLLPFKLTSAVAPTVIAPKRDYVAKTCAILVYAKKFGNATEEKILMQLGVELLPPSLDNCGTHFSASTMTCAVDSDEMKTSLHDPEFCQGNSGGPLMCEGEVMALQSYIENNCNQPHLYQLLVSWEIFINCGVEEKCHLDPHCNICVTIDKDKTSTEPKTEIIETVIGTSTEITDTVIETSTEIIDTVIETSTETIDTVKETTTALPQIEQNSGEETDTEINQDQSSNSTEISDLRSNETETPTTNASESIQSQKTQSQSDEYDELPSETSNETSTNLMTIDSPSTSSTNTSTNESSSPSVKSDTSTLANIKPELPQLRLVGTEEFVQGKVVNASTEKPQMRADNRRRNTASKNISYRLFNFITILVLARKIY